MVWLKRVLLLSLLLAGCARAPEINLDPTPPPPATAAAQYYYTSLAHYRVHELEETIIFARLARDKFKEEKAAPIWVRTASELLARAHLEHGDRGQARAEFAELLQQYPGVASYRRAVESLQAEPTTPTGTP